MASSVGYSGTPLFKKLGLTSGMHVVVRHAPDGYKAMIGEISTNLIFDQKVAANTRLVHVFATKRAILEMELTGLRTAIADDAIIWVSWPKKASKVATDITENTIREIALPLGYVDVKVCAVSDVWSGLKLVVRKALRRS